VGQGVEPGRSQPPQVTKWTRRPRVPSGGRPGDGFSRQPPKKFRKTKLNFSKTDNKKTEEKSSTWRKK